MGDDRVDALERRLAHVEATLEALVRRLGGPAPEPAPTQHELPPPDAAPLVATTASLHQAEAAPRFVARTPDALTAERFFGGRVLLAVGAFTLLLGAGFFIKYAFDNGWIGPAGRVALGLLAGVGFIAAGQRPWRATTASFGAVLTGLGGALLYLSLWAAGNGFHLISIAASFAAMSVVTASLVVIAVRHDSQAIAEMALLGGFVTPLLTATETPQILSLFVYLAILDAALVFVPVSRSWPAVQLTAFAFTQAYVLFSFDTQSGKPLATYLTFATVYLGVFLAQPVRRAWAALRLRRYELMLVAAAAGAYYLTLHAELFAAHRPWLTASVVALAAAFVVVAQRTRSADRSVFAAVGLALITGGVAITFTGGIVAILWAVEGAALLAIGVRRRIAVARLFGYAGFALAALTALGYPPAGGPPFANERFATFAIFALALFAVAALRARAPDDVTELEEQLLLCSEPLGHAALIYAMSYELFDLTHGHELSLTLLWLAYAGALLGAGFLRRRAFARWEGFGILAIAIGKAFLVDMSAVNPAIRIVSFLALGSVMLAISYTYNRVANKAGETA